MIVVLGVIGSLFAGAFCYADDIVLLAPCASALRTMLSICNNFAVSHGLHFNVSKTQLMFSFTINSPMLSHDIVQKHATSLFRSSYTPRSYTH